MAGCNWPVSLLCVFLASMLFNNMSCYLIISAVFLLQANMFGFFWSTAFLHLIFQRNKVRPARYHNKQRSEHVKDRALNGSTHGDANKQTQSQDILKSKNKKEHLFSKTNTEEIIDSERPLPPPSHIFLRLIYYEVNLKRTH